MNILYISSCIMSQMSQQIFLHNLKIELLQLKHMVTTKKNQDQKM